MAPSSQWSPHSERIVIGITGRIGSGKTSVGMYLSSKYAFQYVRYSRIISEWKAGDTENKSRLQEAGWQVMSCGMQSELNRLLIARIGPLGDVAVDGLRHPIDYEALKNSFASVFHLLYIDTSAAVRFDRVKDRGTYANLQAFQLADSHPVERQIENLRQKADFVIRDEGSLENLYAMVDERIQYFKKEGQV